MRLALRLARRGYGSTSPNPMVGAVLVKNGKIIGRGWHRHAGKPHAEIEALRDAGRKGHSPKGATLYVTLEPCSTQGRTPPCTDAIKAAGVSRVVVGATDPNPKHRGRAFSILERAGIEVVPIGGKGKRGETPASPSLQDKSAPGIERLAPCQKMAADCTRLNEAFNHWIVHRTPFVTVKAAMTMDGKIATASGESKWITGEKARAHAMGLRRGADAVLVGVNTVLADDPLLTARSPNSATRSPSTTTLLRRIILDAQARTPLSAKVVGDEFAGATTIVVGQDAPRKRVAALSAIVRVWGTPARGGRIDLPWLLKKLGAEAVMNLLVEGGGEVNASFLFSGFAHRVAFFYAPKILGGSRARKAVAGEGARRLDDVIQLREIEWRRLGQDLLLTARVDQR
jgi:diaminohydroxyphosphoribosylaminopyrimidine deaminase/5-amino-6-(5-phosphoribosylamino)uracil reductase